MTVLCLREGSEGRWSVMVYSVPSFGHQPHEKERKCNHRSISLHNTDNAMQYFCFPVISYHGVDCKHGFEGTSSICSYTGMWNKYRLLQESFRETRKSILTSPSSTPQFLVLPDNPSFTSEMKALSIALFPRSDSLRSDACRKKGKITS